MGTNFYWRRIGSCPHCKSQFDGDGIHIGKSSAGWVFAMHVHPDLGIHNLTDWISLWLEPNSIIRDEYGKLIAPQEMLRIVTERASSGWSDIEVSRNNAEIGPNRLLRAKIDNRSCIGHGEGTWSYHLGDFT